MMATCPSSMAPELAELEQGLGKISCLEMF